MITGEMAAIAEAAITDARHLALNARRGLAPGWPKRNVQGRRPRLRPGTNRDRLGRVAAQARTRLAGTVPDGSTRVVFYMTLTPRPVAKGRLGRPVEFGYYAASGLCRVETRSRYCTRDSCISFRHNQSRPSRKARRASLALSYRSGRDRRRVQLAGVTTATVSRRCS